MADPKDSSAEATKKDSPAASGGKQKKQTPKTSASTDDHSKIQEYPHGLKESPGGKIPIFLKVTYVGMVAFAILYGILYLGGDGSELVELLNKATSQ